MSERQEKLSRKRAESLGLVSLWMILSKSESEQASSQWPECPIAAQNSPFRHFDWPHQLRTNRNTDRTTQTTFLKLIPKKPKRTELTFFRFIGTPKTFYQQNVLSTTCDGWAPRSLQLSTISFKNFSFFIFKIKQNRFSFYLCSFQRRWIDEDIKLIR